MNIFYLLQQKLKYIQLKRILKYCGKNVVIDPGVLIVHPENISIGDNVHLRKGCMIYAGDSTSSPNKEEVPYIIIGDNVHIKENVVLNTYGGSIILEENVVIGQNTVVYGNGGIRVGSGSGFGPLSLIIASNHVFDRLDIPFVLQGETKFGIEIADNVWCAGNVTICDGVKIGGNAVIGAGSVVRKNIPENAVILGNPAQIAYIRS